MGVVACGFSRNDLYLYYRIIPTEMQKIYEKIFENFFLIVSYQVL